jgi:hypothetical protein
LTYFTRDTRHLQKWPEASNAFKRPIFEISILKVKDEKSPHALVQIFSPGGARGDFTLYPLSTHCLPTVKKTPDDVINKSANQTEPICSVLVIARPLVKA